MVKSLFSALASGLNRREDLLSCFMVSLLAWETFRRRPPQGVRLRRLGRASGGLPLLLMLLLMGGRAWAEPKFEVTLDRDTITLGDSAVLSMTFQDCSPSGMPSLPTIANVQFGGQSEQESFSLVGASMTRKKVYSIELHPTRDGNFTIPAMAVMVDGTRLQSRLH